MILFSGLGVIATVVGVVVNLFNDSSDRQSRYSEITIQGDKILFFQTTMYN